MDPINESVVGGFLKAARANATEQELALLNLLIQRRDREVSRVTSTPNLIALTKALKKAKMHHNVEIVIHWLIRQEFTDACPSVMLDLMADALDGDTDLNRMATESMNYAKYPRAVSEYRSWQHKRVGKRNWRNLLAMPPVEMAYMFAVRGIENEPEADWVKEKLLAHVFQPDGEPPAKRSA